MTKTQFIKKHRLYGYLPQQEAAQFVGRKAGGNIPALMARYTVRTLRHKNVNLFFKPDLERVPKLHAAEKARDQFIEKAVARPAELPLGWVYKAKDEKTDAEKLDGITIEDWAILIPNSSHCSNLLLLMYDGDRQCIISTNNLISLARQIVRRIDGEPAPSDKTDYRAKYNELLARLDKLTETIKNEK
jgi:hypothetical protein